MSPSSDPADLSADVKESGQFSSMSEISQEQISPSPRTKAVSIAEVDEIVPPPVPLEHDDKTPKTPKQHPAKVGQRLIGRPSINGSTTSLRSLAHQGSIESIKADKIKSTDESLEDSISRHQNPSKLLAQVAEWLHQEKVKRTKKSESVATSDNEDPLDRLEKILRGNLLVPRKSPKLDARRRSSARKLSAGNSSDTEYNDGDVVVPHCDAILDNTKTLAYDAGGPGAEKDVSQTGKKGKDIEAWIIFKTEILKLTHTFKLKGWRRIPFERSSDLGIERLSGAMTNAIYAVSPPKNLPEVVTQGNEGDTQPKRLSKPSKLLLRIYGAQSDQLIDREGELQILRRLARKKIGPRLLGTFLNGRFEDFLVSKTLTFQDLRVPETSKQIAKRMRELHEGIELLEEERAGGPGVYVNIDKWMSRAEQVMTWLDRKILTGTQGKKKGTLDAWKERGLVLGVEWSVFKKAMEKYRQWLERRYGGQSGIKEQLVFAHNDTQYGNLLRLEPSGESPLLLPANEHKQLVVIDFEYAAANLPGLEFANHFTEWCYNYHAGTGYDCNEHYYPTLEEQQRFVKAYVMHTPAVRVRTPSITPVSGATPSLTPLSKPTQPLPSTSSISSFRLDSRAPPTQVEAEEDAREKGVETEVQRLMTEARLWRPINSAHWICWGIVQAKVKELDEEEERAGNRKLSSVPQIGTPDTVPATLEVAAEAAPEPHQVEERPEGLVAKGSLHEEPEIVEDEEEEEFDYLGYVHERVMLFWGDVLGLGIVDSKDLPESLLKKVKYVKV